jgi:hypothetical protein
MTYIHASLDHFKVPTQLWVLFSSNNTPTMAKGATREHDFGSWIAFSSSSFFFFNLYLLLTFSFRPSPFLFHLCTIFPTFALSFPPLPFFSHFFLLLPSFISLSLHKYFLWLEYVKLLYITIVGSGSRRWN